MAISASGACRLPTCLWARPCWLRIKTSQRGHPFWLISISFAGLRCRRALTKEASGSGFFASLLVGIGHKGVANPCAFFVCLDTGLEALLVTGTMAFDDRIELGPVDFTKVVMTEFLVPFQVWVWHF